MIQRAAAACAAACARGVLFAPVVYSPRDQLASLWGRFARVALRLLRAGLEMCLALPRNE